MFPGLGRIGPPSCTYILPWAGMGTFDSANFRPFGRFRECDTGCPFFGLAPRGKLESEEGSIDAPMVRPRPGYRRRSVPGPTAVERRRWLGLGRRIGRGRRPARDAPSFHRGRNAERPSRRPTSSSLPAADRSNAVQEIHHRTTGGRSAPLVRPGSAHRARLRSGRGALVNC